MATTSSTDTVTVTLPDFNVSFLTDAVVENPGYAKARDASQAWIVQECNLDEKGSKMLTKGDFTYFCAVSVPNAGYEKYRTYCDWVNWVFPFDDFFDSGELKNDPARAKALLDNLVACMKNVDCIKDPGSLEGEDYVRTEVEPMNGFVRAHTNVAKRVKEGGSKATYDRFVKVVTMWADAVFQQVLDCSRKVIPRPDQMIQTRRETIGVRPLHVFLEFTQDLRLPDEVFDHPSIQEMETLGADWVLIQNDVLSYSHEEAEDVQHNLITACRVHGMCAQEAFNHLDTMIKERYARFAAAEKAIPSWGKQVDAEVKKYIDGIKDIIKANLVWSLRTERYFGTRTNEVVRTNTVEVLKEPAYLRLLSSSSDALGVEKAFV